MAGGYKSPLPAAFGTSSAPVVTQGGTRSMLAFWMGGANTTGIAPVTPGGFRSMMAFWAGGAAAGEAIPIETPARAKGGGPDAQRRKGSIDEQNEIIMMIIKAFLEREG